MNSIANKLKGYGTYDTKLATEEIERLESLISAMDERLKNQSVLLENRSNQIEEQNKEIQKLNLLLTKATEIIEESRKIHIVTSAGNCENICDN